MGLVVGVGVCRFSSRVVVVSRCFIVGFSGFLVGFGC